MTELILVRKGGITAQVNGAIAAQKDAANGIAPLDANREVSAFNSRVKSVFGRTGDVGILAGEAGEIRSIAGVSNPGGGISVVPSGAIVLTPDNAANSIGISENLGTAAGLQRVGNLLSIATEGVVGSMVSPAIKDALPATQSLRSLGTGAQQAAAGNDGRLSDARTPTDASVTLPKAAAEISLALICTSTTRPASPKEGQLIYQTDTDTVLVNTGTPVTPAWTNVGGGGGSVSDASTTVKGVTKLSFVPAVATNPIAVGDNDPRMPGAAQSFFTTKSASQGVAINAAVKITFDVASSQNGGGFDTVNSRFVADAVGQVFVYFVFTATGAADGTNVVIELYKNGVFERYIGGAHAGSTRALIASGGRLINVAAGDFLEFYVEYFAPAGSQGLTASASQTHVSGYYVRR